MHQDLHSRVAVVTGGGRGLGLEIGTALAEQGADVALLDLSDSTTDVAANLAEHTNVRTVGLACDVTDPQSLAAVFGQVGARLGQPALLVTPPASPSGATAKACRSSSGAKSSTST